MHAFWLLLLRWLDTFIVAVAFVWSSLHSMIVLLDLHPIYIAYMFIEYAHIACSRCSLCLGSSLGWILLFLLRFLLFAWYIITDKGYLMILSILLQSSIKLSVRSCVRISILLLSFTKVDLFTCSPLRIFSMVFLSSLVMCTILL